MDQRSVELINLCLSELQMVRQLLDLKVADDFCSRMLGIYATMRVDDITKIWSHQVPQGTLERYIADNVKNEYNQGLRMVRDKLGAHYQTPDGKEDLFKIVELFKSIDYANTVCMIDSIFYVESQIEGREITADGFTYPDDLNTAKEVLEELYSDNQTFLTNGTLDVFGMNKGGLIACSEPQVKGQNLKSIELMVDVAQRLLNRKYEATEVKRLFERLYVTMVYNYHDKLITRTDIKDKAAQYEEGFDVQFKKLITKKDDKATLEIAFDKFEAKYQVKPVIKKYRDTRNKACAHFDEGSTVADINKLLDALDIVALEKVYEDMLKLFNYICSNVFLLKMLNLPARVPVYGSKMVTLRDNDNFYGEGVENQMPKEMGVTEIMRSIRKEDNRYGEACDALAKRLMGLNETAYDEMIEAIALRLKEPTVSEGEMSVIIQSLRNSTGGNPERTQRSLLLLIMDNDIFCNCGVDLLWVFSAICREDEAVDIRQILDDMISHNQLITTSFAILAFLHLTMVKERFAFTKKRRAHEVSEDLKRYCDGVKQSTEKLALMLMLSQHWFCGQEYGIYRECEDRYSDYFKAEVAKALDGYFAYIKLKESEERERCENFLKSHHYLLLLNRLVIMENNRNQKPNLFLEMWRHNCYILLKSDMYEALGVGVMFELSGDKQRAREIIETVANDYPISDDAKATLEGFYERNPEMKG